MCNLHYIFSKPICLSFRYDLQACFGSWLWGWLSVSFHIFKTKGSLELTSTTLCASKHWPSFITRTHQWTLRLGWSLSRFYWHSAWSHLPLSTAFMLLIVQPAHIGADVSGSLRVAASDSSSFRALETSAEEWLLPQSKYASEGLDAYIGSGTSFQEKGHWPLK